jgi:hypothetical protein
VEKIIMATDHPDPIKLSDPHSKKSVARKPVTFRDIKRQPERNEFDTNCSSTVETKHRALVKQIVLHSPYSSRTNEPDLVPTNPTWFLVQVNQPQTDYRTTEDLDMYRVKWWIRHHQGSKTSLQCNCRFWPEVHKLNPNVSLGPTQPVKLTKADRFIEPDPQV